MSSMKDPDPGDTGEIEDSGSRPTSLSPRLLHDLRSPLNQIIGYSEMLAEDAARDDVADLKAISTAGHRILTLLEKNFIAFDEDGSETVDEGEDEAFVAVPVASRVHDPGRGMLLVVDDDAANRDVLSRRLRNQGYDVVTVSNGHDALRLMHETAFDLVLLDILMPDMDGYAVLGQVKADEQLQHIPVIMISALSEVQSVVRCIAAGAEDYLAKPFDPTLLRARIGASLEKKRGRDRETALFDQLQSNYKTLQSVEKLRDDMRNMIVHDLRTPLTAMIVGVEMLEKYGELNPTQREMMTIAVGGGNTLLGMINDLLDVEKMESGATQLKYDELSADALVSQAVSQVASLARLGQIVIATEIAPEVSPFPGDENKLGRTLVNLLANAIKFTREGTVTVVVSQVAPETIRFAVQDTGTGIPAEEFERIFEKFGQLDRRSKVGTGLGLAFCKLAVEAHGGEIQVESTPGLGSTFSFTIPLRARDA